MAFKLTAAVIVGAALGLLLFAEGVPVPVPTFGTQASTPTEHYYPSPSDWPQAPIAPCQSSCTSQYPLTPPTPTPPPYSPVPSDPGTGPVIASPGTQLHCPPGQLIYQRPDGTFYCA